MKDWWRKWSYEIPLAFGDALREVLVVQFADFLSRLTARRVVEFIVIAMLAMAFAQTFPIDLAILFAGDTLMYLEILMIVRLAAGREFFQAVWHLATRLAGAALGAVRRVVAHPGPRVRRPGERRHAPQRHKRRDQPDRSEDADGFGTAPALAWA